MAHERISFFASIFVAASFIAPGNVVAEVPSALLRWLAPQDWQHDSDKSVISLGPPGDFDDHDLLSPAVADHQGKFLMWYCGRATKDLDRQRVYNLGLATSSDGKHFEKYRENPVFKFGDEKHSILTPCLLRNPNGTVLRENGQFRMWFSAPWLPNKDAWHTLREISSPDGVQWSKPSEVLLNYVYAPTVIKDEDGRYRMWYTDVSSEPWCIRHASSSDGTKWDVTSDAVLHVDQKWERSRLFYPIVIKIDGAYLMWYGSYWTERALTTALGFAVSTDGLIWHKHPSNPVLRPDPQRPWMSHYVTSGTVMQLPDGRFRIWHACRTKPPFVNEYFAIDTAVWTGPEE